MVQRGVARFGGGGGSALQPCIALVEVLHAVFRARGQQRGEARFFAGRVRAGGEFGGARVAAFKGRELRIEQGVARFLLRAPGAKCAHPLRQTKRVAGRADEKIEQCERQH